MNAALPVPVSYLLVEHPGEEPITPFDATLHTIPVTVTAVLEKTVVYEIGTEEWPKREQAKATDVLVDPLALSWRGKPTAKTGDPRTWRTGGRRRQASDEEKAEQVQRNEALVADSKRSAAARLAADLAADKIRVERAAAERRSERGEEIHVMSAKDLQVLSGIPTPGVRLVATTAGLIRLESLLFPWPHLDPDLIKRCPKCTEVKPREAFAKSKANKDGRQGQCRECMKVYWAPKPAAAPTHLTNQAEIDVPLISDRPAWLTADVVWWPQLDIERIRKFAYTAQAPALVVAARLQEPGPKIIRTEKRCPRCDTVKSIEEFHRHPTKADGRQSWCKTCKAPAAAGKIGPLERVDQLRTDLEAIVAENVELRRRTEQLEGIFRHLAEHIQEQLAR